MLSKTNSSLIVLDSIFSWLQKESEILTMDVNINVSNINNQWEAGIHTYQMIIVSGERKSIRIKY